MSDPHDWETAPRSLADCLIDWQMRLNGGKSYRARAIAATELRYDKDAYGRLLVRTRPPIESHQRLIRRAMVLIDRERG